eukprot:TRINITY_DN106193_c0_g1_i1.p1 TRINITY_DN106193_c0_g1~~TRINITY_DN106193_c0_g1_i1.p1  ORF type:complete len:525 (-),score=153.58 TRINITY_DN106193_c0_g1_i1:93-1667(-)
MGRTKAARALQDALVNQFGPSARDTVEAEVASHLKGRKQLTRSDLDALEESILAKLRKRRSSAGHCAPAGKAEVRSMSHSLTAPSLQGFRDKPSRDFTLGGAPGRGSPPKTASQCLAQSGTVQASLSSTASQQLSVLPRTPQVKPMDCFDLFAEFDTIKHLTEEADKKKEQKVKAMKFRQTLDLQIEEVKAVRAAEADEEAKIRAQMLAQAKANAELAAAEQKKEMEKREQRRQVSLEYLECMQRKKNEEATRARLEKNAFDRTLLMEEKHENQDMAEKQQFRAHLGNLMRGQMQASFNKRANEKQATRQDDLRLAEEWRKSMSGPSAADQPGGPVFKIKEGQKRVDALVQGMGVPLIQRQQAQERAHDHRIEMQRRAHEKENVDDYWRRKDDNDQQVSAMVSTWDWQVRSASGKGSEEHEANLRQAELWRQEAEKSQKQEQAKEAARRLARKDMDKQLFSTMLQNAGVHKSEKGVTEEWKQRELTYNRPLIENISAAGYSPEKTGTMLLQATATGKLKNGMSD